MIPSWASSESQRRTYWTMFACTPVALYVATRERLYRPLSSHTVSALWSTQVVAVSVAPAVAPHPTTHEPVHIATPSLQPQVLCTLTPPLAVCQTIIIASSSLPRSAPVHKAGRAGNASGSQGNICIWGVPVGEDARYNALQALRAVGATHTPYPSLLVQWTTWRPCAAAGAVSCWRTCSAAVVEPSSVSHIWRCWRC